MTLTTKTVRLLSRLTDRMDLIRKNPHRYEIAEADLAELDEAARRVEDILARITTIKAG
jgi:hypothetical protein